MAPISLLLMTIMIMISHSDSTESSSSTHRFLNEHNKHTTTTTMILPLHHQRSTHRNHSVDRTSRRLHQSTPNAHMRLYDDLLANGYYTTRLWIGTPPQKFALIVDTGSTVTYVPCSNCEQCGNHQDPRFQPELSTTYQPVKCNPDCNCDDEGKQCTYERRYAEMSSSSGVVAEDIISFGNESELTPQRALFGCENIETGDLYSQHADGIIGLGRGRLSIVDQLVDKSVISDSFSLCYGGMHVGGGAMVLGKISPPEDMVFSHSDPFRSPYYNIELKELHVAGKPLKLSPKVFDQRHGTVLDSGTTYAYFPEEAFVAFKDALMNEIRSLKKITGPDPSYKDICFSGAGRDVSELSKVFPGVDMVFSSGKKLSLSPENYLFRHTKVSGAYCLGIFQNSDSTTLLGGILVRNTLVTYDREDNKIGFWKTNCSDLWKNLQPPAAAPTNTNDGNNTSDGNIGFPPTIAPAPAPSRSPSDILPGSIRIGLITIDMEITSNNPNVKPNFTELTEIIAHELEVDESQLEDYRMKEEIHLPLCNVYALNLSAGKLLNYALRANFFSNVRLLKYTSKENAYLVKWGIFPAHSANYISNTTASDIILRLKEHRMKFPQKVGSYQLVEWNVEPQTKQNWWKHQFMTVIIGSVVTLVICLSAIGIWFVWRRRQATPYEAVDSNGAVAEQELQPLQS
ncbi:hypothetical protein ACFE04_004946 [Oxalis oulophora]